jgi:insulysin
MWLFLLLAHFKNFIATHGGNTNAYTVHTLTYYYFSVTNKILEGLDIFSNFFIDPLFNKKYVEKEVNAVCSEHNKNISIDGWRVYSLIKKFFDDSHNNTFSCGNKETLFNDNDTDKLIKKLREFFNDFYNPDKMILIVSHKKIDDKFIDKTVSMFKKIPNKKTKTTNYEPKITYPY